MPAGRTRLLSPAERKKERERSLVAHFHTNQYPWPRVRLFEGRSWCMSRQGFLALQLLSFGLGASGI